MSRQNHQLDPRDRSRFQPFVLVLGGLSLVGIGLGACGSAPKPIAELIPETDRQEAVGDDYHGTWIPDPYRWLEDQDGAETAAWTTLQNGATEAYLDAVPARERLRQRLTELWNYPRVGAPGKAGESWYFSKNDGLQNQSVIYKANSPTGTGTVFLDPNTFSKDGTVSLAGMSFSKDGHYVAYAISLGPAKTTTGCVNGSVVNSATRSVPRLRMPRCSWTFVVGQTTLPRKTAIVSTVRDSEIWQIATRRPSSVSLPNILAFRKKKACRSRRSVLTDSFPNSNSQRARR